MPYFLMVALYSALALLTALDTSLINLAWLPGFAAVPWLRVHIITLGIFTELVFGLASILQSRPSQQPNSGFRWDSWLVLNMGLPVLLVGIPLFDPILISTGGTLILTATILLIQQLIATQKKNPTHLTASSKFYIAGLAYLLLGIFLGMGLWQGWGEVLRLVSVKEIHVHANLWGFAALSLAGLIIDLYPGLSGRKLVWSYSVDIIFWFMAIGAFGLVLGPWVQSQLISTLGLILHSFGTLYLLINIIKPLGCECSAWTPTMLHLVSAYIWFSMPVFVAPLIVFRLPDFPVASFEQRGGPILIYGWLLQSGYAIIPYLFSRIFLPDDLAKPDGNYFTLLAVHGGAVLYWFGLFVPSQQNLLHGLAFSIWGFSMLPIVWGIWHSLYQKYAGRGTAYSKVVEQNWDNTK
jgi:cytochrome c oxidase cbb3-type subunit 1